MSEISRVNFAVEYNKITEVLAEQDWDREWGTVPTGSSKTALESRSIKHYLLEGDLLEVWQNIEKALNKRSYLRLARMTPGGDAAAGAGAASAGGGGAAMATDEDEATDNTASHTTGTVTGLYLKPAWIEKVLANLASKSRAAAESGAAAAPV